MKKIKLLTFRIPVEVLKNFTDEAVNFFNFMFNKSVLNRQAVLTNTVIPTSERNGKYTEMFYKHAFQ
jgi:hypothetical protein